MSRAENIVKTKKQEKRERKRFNASWMKSRSEYKTRRKTGVGWGQCLCKKATAIGQALGAFGRRRMFIDQRRPLSPIEQVARMKMGLIEKLKDRLGAKVPRDLWHGDGHAV